MAKARSQQDGGAPGADTRAGAGTNNDPENVGLLSGHGDDEEDEFHEEDKSSTPPPPKTIKSAVRQQHPPLAADTSSFTTTSTNTPADQTPRTPQRVRFDPNPTILHGLTPNGTANSFESSRRNTMDSYDSYGHREDSLDDLDFQFDGGDEDESENRRHRRPLLTGIEAPSVALANSPWSLDEHDDVHSWAESERARPKSNLQAAFMNMANSIIGAGIIGQPYAFKQAGLLSGILLLVGLTIVVDWTICLIVVNSKLSGANSFQGTVEKCFGKSGLIAISLAQWLFAFGGMVAFGVIVGDTIPHVLQAVWPGLREMPVLGLLADRRAAIVVFVLGVSFPLTLYRDIAKVCLRYFFFFDSEVVVADLGTANDIARESQYARADQHDRYNHHSRGAGRPDPFRRPRIVRHSSPHYQLGHLPGNRRHIIWFVPFLPSTLSPFSWCFFFLLLTTSKPLSATITPSSSTAPSKRPPSTASAK